MIPWNKGLKQQFCSKGHDRNLQTRTSNQRNCHTCALNRNRTANWKTMGILNSDGSIFTTADFDRAYQIQQGRCANKACNKHQSELASALHADHDHSTGFFRGILCGRCNRAIGQVRDSKELMKGLIEYLGGLENE